MTHELYITIICTIVAAGIIIIGKLYDRIEKLKAELDEAKAEARTLDADLDDARRNNRLANAHIEKLNAQLDVLAKRLSKYNKEAKGWKIKFSAVTTENKELREKAEKRQAELQKTIQRLYGRIGAMQRQINQREQERKEKVNLINFLSIKKCIPDGQGTLIYRFGRWYEYRDLTKPDLKQIIKDNGLDGFVDIDLLKPD